MTTADQLNSDAWELFFFCTVHHRGVASAGGITTAAERPLVPSVMLLPAGRGRAEEKSKTGHLQICQGSSPAPLLCRRGGGTKGSALSPPPFLLPLTRLCTPALLFPSDTLNQTVMDVTLISDCDSSRVLSVQILIWFVKNGSFQLLSSKCNRNTSSSRYHGETYMNLLYISVMSMEFINQYLQDICLFLVKYS